MTTFIIVYLNRRLLMALNDSNKGNIPKSNYMTTKQLLIALTASGLPKGELKEEMFKFYNSMVGKSKFFPKSENPKTGCGSCIQRVKTSIWKWYHTDEKAPSYKGLVFTGRLAAHNIPVYIFDDAKSTKQEG